MAKEELSRRVLSCKVNGRLGGRKTAETHSQEFLEERASKAGSACRDTYGIGFYSFLGKSNKQLRKKLGKASVLQTQAIQQILPSATEDTTTADLMKASVTKLPKLYV